jgi:hypothetical protein
MLPHACDTADTAGPPDLWYTDSSAFDKKHRRESCVIDKVAPEMEIESLDRQYH